MPLNKETKPNQTNLSIVSSGLHPFHKNVCIASGCELNAFQQLKLWSKDGIHQ